MKTLYAPLMETREKAHHYLAYALDLPSYYGLNLDALWDVLSEQKNQTILVLGEMPEASIAILELFEEAHLHGQIHLQKQSASIEQDEQGYLFFLGGDAYARLLCAKDDPLRLENIVDFSSSTREGDVLLETVLYHLRSQEFDFSLAKGILDCPALSSILERLQKAFV